MEGIRILVKGLSFITGHMLTAFDKLPKLSSSVLFEKVDAVFGVVSLLFNALLNSPYKDVRTRMSLLGKN